MSMLNKNNCMAIRKQWQPLARFLLGMRSIRGFSLRYPETSLYSCLAFRKRFGIRYAWDMRPIRFTAVSAKLKKQKGAIRGLKRFAANWAVSAHRTATKPPAALTRTARSTSPRPLPSRHRSLARCSPALPRPLEAGAPPAAGEEPPPAGEKPLGRWRAERSRCLAVRTPEKSPRHRRCRRRRQTGATAAGHWRKAVGCFRRFMGLNGWCRSS
jgi:hypothetical protein